MSKSAQILQKLTRPIVLVGMMGAGKSALGTRLADKLGLGFTDADNAIEEAAQMSIAEIFEAHGEAAFRDGERRVIKRLLGDGPQVLALGGGAFVDADTRALVKQKAVSVWLDVPLDELVARVKKKPGKRPLLVGQDVRAKLQELLDARGGAYSEADIRAPIGGGSHEHALDALLAALHAYLNEDSAPPPPTDKTG